MTATAARVRPWNHSETLLRGFAGQPPFKGCGISTDCHGTGMATLLESDTASDGRLVSKAVRTARLKRGWRGFTKVADSNGIPDTGDLVRIHRAMYPGLPDPIEFHTRDFSQVVARMRGGFAVSIALRLRVLGLTNSIDFTNADHQALIWGAPKDGEVWCMGPMRPHSDTYDGHRAKIGEIERAAKAIEGGLILTWLYPIGGWTKAARETKGLRTALREARRRVTTLDGRIRDRNATIADQRERIKELEAGQGTDCSGPIAAALETERITIRELVDDRRSL